ncbi:Trp biosynthesis-associated membrane protein [Streptosporangium sp. NPDC000239]|uniref:Trp biosynthesis-associated membrane protein n=1 Tax=unclassified Streptosporangium TaxID=2632669 RepID=UPI00331B596E
MRAGRALWTWVAACAAGAGLVLLAAGRDWVTVRYGTRAVPVSAAELAPALAPAAWAALAAVVAVLATRGVWRRVIGVVMALCGAGVIVAVAAGGGADAGLAAAAGHAPMAAAAETARATGHLLWPVLAGAGGLVLLAGGAVAALWSVNWPGMSERYERRGAARGSEALTRAGASGSGRAMWDAIDLGADPTADPATDSPTDSATDSTAEPAADPGRDGR